MFNREKTNPQEWIRQHYPNAIMVFAELLEQKKQNLINGGYEIKNAAVARSDFRQEIQSRFKVYEMFANEIEKGLIASGYLHVFGGYAVFTQKGKDQVDG